jgi:hypothetical protein
MVCMAFTISGPLVYHVIRWSVCFSIMRDLVPFEATKAFGSGRSHRWGEAGGPVIQWLTAILPDWSQSHPVYEGVPLHPMRGCDASAVSHADTGPAREPYNLSEGHDWTRQGTDGFLGHATCQGQTLGFTARRHGLDPDGCVVRHKAAGTNGTKTGMRLQPYIGGRVGPGELNGNNCSTLCRGEVLPLDKSLLMGV